jgi:undecaprenyl-diphosphatase
MIILATIPVGIAGLAFEHTFRVVFGKPVYAAVFLAVNGLILLAGERFARRTTRRPGQQRAAAPEPELALTGAGRPGVARHAAGHQAIRSQELAEAVDSDQRLSEMGYARAVLIGSAQILALLAGISRGGVTW